MDKDLQQKAYTVIDLAAAIQSALRVEVKDDVLIISALMSLLFGYMDKHDKGRLETIDYLVKASAHYDRIVRELKENGVIV